MSDRRASEDPAAHDPLLDPPAWAPSWLPTVDDVRGVRVLRWVLFVVFFAGLAACMSRGADEPEDPVLGPEPGSSAASTTSSPGSGGSAGDLAAAFGSVVAELVSASGELVELCLLLADTPEERGRGLMEVADLQGHDGMAFASETTTDSPFYMYRTPTPLTIAWWDGTGAFVSATDMAPCASERPDECPRYAPAGAYRFALEVPQGSPLTERFRPGASLRLGDRSCPA